MATFRRLGAKTAALVGKLRLMMGTVTGIALTYGVYKTTLGSQLSYMKARSEAPPPSSTSVQRPPFETEDPRSRRVPPPPPPAGKCQPSVTSHDKAYALFLHIRLKEGVDARQVASSVAKLQQYVDEVEASSVSCCGNFRVFAGVGFGPEFYQRLKGGGPPPYTNANHDLLCGDGAGGDVLIHAKSNLPWTLQRLSQAVLQKLPEGCVLSHQETLGQHKDAEVVAKRQSPGEHLGILNYQYSKGELELLPPSESYKPNKPNLMFVQESGHQDTEVKRRESAVDPATGGSYVLTQRWEHDVTLVDPDGKVSMHEWVDKAWEQCASTGYEGERRFKPLNALGADLATQYTDKWMGEAYQDCLDAQKKKPQIVCALGNYFPASVIRLVRQSVPYQKSGGEFGLFFISYCRAPRPHELLMDRMIASTCSEDRLNAECSKVFQMSHNVHSAVWYFPGLDELKGLQ